ILAEPGGFGATLRAGRHGHRLRKVHGDRGRADTYGRNRRLLPPADLPGSDRRAGHGGLTVSVFGSSEEAARSEVHGGSSRGGRADEPSLAGGSRAGIEPATGERGDARTDRR